MKDWSLSDSKTSENKAENAVPESDSQQDSQIGAANATLAGLEAAPETAVDALAEILAGLSPKQQAELIAQAQRLAAGETSPG